MARLARSGTAASHMLTEQYRMHPTICAAVSTSFYNGKLKTGAPTAAARVQ